ncbi:helix-turn-helix domain-containing protein [Neobacillus terrae]|uniref:helix-turn-helix domain-containing protein n=1 Tax=Neobacillus terrae TaxID=3034837 RepID=UPI00140B8561|nr:helix-turn-helix transcriptional regulator [Neobacillus terrae]NHM32078.1 helix-turn-helix transcriptional regulator [Neobacillus terrae]
MKSEVKRMYIRSKLKKLRTEYNLTLQEIAEQLGYSTGYVGHIERGISKPSEEFLRKISVLFNIPFEVLLDQNIEAKDLMISRSVFSVKDIRDLAKKYSLFFATYHAPYLVNTVKIICKGMNLPFTIEDNGGLLINKEVYQVIELFFMNKSLFLKGDKDIFITHKEVLSILGGVGRSFNIMGTIDGKDNDKWLNLIDKLPVQFYYNYYFYFLKKDVLEFKAKIVTRDQIWAILEKERGIKISKSLLNKTLYKDFSDFEIKWLPSNIKRYPKEIINLLKTHFLEGKLNSKKIFDISDFLHLYRKYLSPSSTSSLKHYEPIIITICEALDLPYQSNSKLTFGYDVLHVLKRFLINQAKYFSEEEEFVSFNEALKIICNIKSTTKMYDKKNTKRNLSLRANWLSFLNNMPVQFFYKNGFYFLKSDVLRFKETTVNTEELKKILREQNGLHVKDESLSDILNSKYQNYLIEWLPGDKLYSIKILEKICTEFKPDYSKNDTYISLVEAAKKLGCKKERLRNFFKNEIIISTSRKLYVHKHDIDYWEIFREETVPLIALLKHLSKKKKKDALDQSYNAALLAERMKSESIRIINGTETPFNQRYSYVYKEDIEKIKNMFEEVMIKRDPSLDKVNKFKSLVINMSNNKANVSMREFFNFALKRLELKGTYVNSMIDFYKIISTIDKELFSYSDEEIESLLIFYSKERGKDANRHICLFLNELQKKYDTKYKNIYRFDKRNAYKKTEGGVSPYTEEQYFRFGFLLLNETHAWYKEYLEKALENTRFASLWLYSLLHYICAWRRIDMINQLPHPNLNMQPDEFFTLIRDNQFTEEIAFKITTEVEMRVHYLNLKPLKTKKFNPPNLVFEIPESIRYRLGMLLGLCEAHRKSKNNKYLISSRKFNIKEQIDFFGPEFTNIFKGNGLNNLRLNKTFQIHVAKIAEKKKIGTGYILSSFARSHMCKGDQKTNTTSVYLEGYRKLTDGEIVMRELFERGVCSFVPYLVLKIIEGEENVLNMSLPQQTKSLKTFSELRPYDLEMLLVQFNEILEKSKKQAVILIEEFGVKGDIDSISIEKKKSIYRFLNTIANGEAPAREKNMNCISVAKGIGCIEPNRKTCIGCGQEIYLKTTLFVIGQRLRELAACEVESKTDNEKNKYRKLIDSMFTPVLREILFALQKIFNIGDLEEIREIIFGIGEKNRGEKI